MYLGKGYRGLLVSYGNYFIRYNTLIPAHWLEFELNLKGIKSDEDLTLSWSYRLGYRLHFNPEIRSYIYAGFKRSHLDALWTKMSILKNSYAEMRADIGVDPFRFQTLTLVIGKKFPLPWKPLVAEINIGYSWLFNDAFIGSLSDGDRRNLWKIILTPNISF